MTLMKMECKATILIKEIDISRLMTFTEQVKSGKLNKMRSWDSKKSHYDDVFSYGKSSGGEYRQGQGSSKGTPQKFDKEKEANPKVQGDVKKGGAIPPKCSRCGMNHMEECIRGTNGFFRGGKTEHKITECPNVTNKYKEGCPQSQVAQRWKVQNSSQACSGGPYCNRFYALHARQEVDEAPDMVIVC